LKLLFTLRSRYLSSSSPLGGGVDLKLFEAAGTAFEVIVHLEEPLFIIEFAARRRGGFEVV
jgi:hypothetical protein